MSTGQGSQRCTRRRTCKCQPVHIECGCSLLTVTDDGSLDCVRAAAARRRTAAESADRRVGEEPDIQERSVPQRVYAQYAEQQIEQQPEQQAQLAPEAAAPDTPDEAE